MLSGWACARPGAEGGSVTDSAGNAIATVLVATWTKELDRPQLDAVLAGDRSFDEATMLDDDGHGGGSSHDTLADLRDAAERESAERQAAERAVH